ncbi:FG-GAP-like repeat-containing protein [Marinoscillum sp.]|uniref:FG-GAP-like repeat-containing protein n=1 Tax=Marinoscillum sp. TaxID=2024838 RepID=UPI003BABC603
MKSQLLSLLFFVFLGITNVFGQISLSSSSPARNQINVDRTSAVTMTFSGNIDQSSIDNSTADPADDQIRISGSFSGLIAGTYSGDGTSTITFTPDTDFKAGEKITVVISDNVAGSLAETVEASVFSFQTSSDAINAEFAFPENQINAKFVNFDADTYYFTPVEAYPVDYDGDGDLDVVSFNETSVWLHTNDGSQSYTKTSLVTGMNRFTRGMITDLDQDGDYDLVVNSNLSVYHITWYENDGSSNFTSSVLVSNVGYGADFDIADMDLDGDQDIITIYSDGVEFHENDGSESFSSTTLFDLNGFEYIRISDIDGDGDLDLLTTDYSSSNLDYDIISWYENDGALSFTENQVTSSAGQPIKVIPVDVDGDNDIDLVSAEVENDRKIVYRNDGSESFTANILPGSCDGLSDIGVADLDGDGDLDVHCTCSTDQKISWFLYNGTTGFVEKDVPSNLNSPDIILHADMDNDGDLDLFASSGGSSSEQGIFWFENQPTLKLSNSISPSQTLGSFHTTDTDITISFTTDGYDLGTFTNSTCPVTGSLSGVVEGAFAQSSSDTKDVIFDPSVDFSPGETVTITLTTGIKGTSGEVALPAQHSFQVKPTSSADPAFDLPPRTITNFQNNATEVHLVDIDQDGDLDVFSGSSSQAGDGIYWYENDGANNYTENLLLADYQYFTSVISGDINQDGEIDLVYFLETTGYVEQLVWLENDGSEGFTTHLIDDYNTHSSIIRTEELRLSDLDKDGDLDLLPANSDDLIWYENQSGTFIYREIDTSQGAYFANSADIDQDGDIDLLYSMNGKISWMENDGNMNFTEHVINSSAAGYTSIYAYNLNGSGGLEVIGYSSTANKLAWYGNSSGTFTENLIDIEIPSNTTVPNSFQLVPMDDDNYIDILINSYAGDEVLILMNNANTFTKQGISSNYKGASDVEAGDMDGDGDMDVVSSSYTLSKLVVFENSEVFTVDSSTPNMGANSVALNADIELVKSYTIVGWDETTLTSENVKVQGSISGLISAQVSVSGSTLTINPDSDFKSGEKVVVTLSDRIKTTSGGALMPYTLVPHRLEFTAAVEEGPVQFPQGKRIITSGTKYADAKPFPHDMDGDDDIDFIYAIDNDLSWYENDGDQGFTKHAISTLSNYLSTITTGDLDQDGDVDILVALDNTEGITWFKNDGSNNYSEVELCAGCDQRTTSYLYSDELYIIDVNGDGAMDIASVQEGYNIYLNNGNDNFSFSQITPSKPVRSAVPVDVDGDGDLDFISQYISNTEVAWWENLDNLQYTEHQLSSSFEAVGVVGEDLNGDDLPDIIAFGGSGINYWINQGDKTFVETQLTSTSTTQLWTGDVDGDGDNDIMLKDRFLLNDALDFSEESVFLSSSGIEHAVLTDLDQDGDYDILGSSQVYNEELVWLEQEYPALELLSTVPANNALNVEQDASIVLNFDGPVDATSLDTASIYVQSALMGYVAGTLSGGGTSEISFTPDTLFRAGDKITIVATDSLQRENGKLGSVGKTAQFTIKSAYGAGKFPDEPITVAEVIRPWDLHLTDIDGDGDLDIFSGSGDYVNGEYNAWYENDGSMSFTEHIIDSSVGYAKDFSSGDLDRDGDMDLVGESAGKLYWYENDGAESFTPHAFTSQDTDFASHVIDINQDGWPDIVYASYQSVIALINDGDGTFTYDGLVSLGTSNDVDDVVVKDVDGDGHLDLITASFDQNSVRWFQNDGSLNFTNYDINLSAFGSFALDVTDLDEDGDMDIIGASISDDKVIWYENDGSQSFTAQLISSSVDGAYDVEVMDLDGDGDMDIIATASSGFDLVWFENDGAQNFTENLVDDNLNTIRSVAVGDMDNDGDGDLVTAVGYSLNKLLIYEQKPVPLNVTTISPTNGATNISNDSNIEITFDAEIDESTIDRNRISVFGDRSGYIEGVFSRSALTITFTPDTLLMAGEVVTVSVTDSLIGTNEEVGVPKSYQFRVASTYRELISFPEPVSINTSTANFAREIELIDLDEDGDLDVISAAFDDDRITWYENVGDNVFNETALVYSVDGVSDIEVQDIDGDGDLDVVGVAFYGGEVSWFENNGSESFTTHVISTNSSRPYNVTTGDFDLDGDMDIISTSTTDNRLVWHRNDGSENFTDVVLSSSGTYGAPLTVTSSDLDDDQDMDILVAYNNAYAWYESTEDGFVEQILPGTTGGRFIEGVDMDQDGDIDLVTVRQNGNVLWHENDGSESFTAHEVTSDVRSWYMFTLADVNGDGFIDIITGVSNRPYIYFNDENQSFTPYYLPFGNYGHFNVKAGDTDADGDLDLVTAGNTTDNIMLFQQVTPLGVSATNPARLASDVDVASNITITLDREVDQSSVTSETVIVKGEHSGLIAGSFTFTSNEITFDPTADFKAGEQISVNVSSSVKDTEGDGTQGYAFSFYTAINDGDNAFDAAQISVVTGLSGAKKIVSVDLDKDGDVDIVTDSDANKLIWYENDGKMNYSPHDISLSVGLIMDFAQADIDLDGDVDLVVSKRTDNKLVWLDNDGSLNFTETTIEANSSYKYGSLIVEDVNGDGWLDVICQVPNINYLIFYSNSNTQAFTPKIELYSVGRAMPLYLATGDFNGDGIFDVGGVAAENTFCCDTFYGDVRWLGYRVDLNDYYDYGFADVQVSGQSIDVGDLDQNGTYDAIVGDESNNLVFYSGDGEGGFIGDTLMTHSSKLTGMKVADLDGDLDVDVIGIHNAENKLVWYENDGSESFIENSIHSSFSGLADLNVADYDSDGDLDIIALDSISGAILLFKNNDTPSDITVTFESIIPENTAPNFAVAKITSPDNDDDTHTFSLVAGSGDADNASFEIGGVDNDSLISVTQFDFETKPSYAVRIQTDDGSGGILQKEFTINVTDQNDTPSDITLNSESIDENLSIGTVVGDLSTTDQDASDSHSYDFATGNGDTDNSSFTISGTQLLSAEEFDVETKSSYSIRLVTDDGNGGTYEEEFTITINDDNDAPTDITLNSESIDENQVIGTVVGDLSTADQDALDSHSYDFASGTGDSDNGSFTISGTQLLSAEEFDVETKSSYSIRLVTDDGNGGTYEEAFTITINDINDTPTDITLSSQSIGENLSIGTAVGDLTTTDQDASDNHSYDFATGTGDTDNGSFTISGTQLLSAEVFNIETKSSYSIRLMTDDGNGGTYEEEFTITINDGNDAPTDITLSSESIDENLSVGTVVGDLSTSDQDASDSHSYDFAAGTGDTDNDSFTISGTQLLSGEVFDTETKSSYSIRLVTDDGNGGTYEKEFTITINDGNDAPTDISLSANSIDENLSVGTVVADLTSTDQDATDSHSYDFAAGTGDTDNDSFTISGTQLLSGEVFDTETKSSYSIRLATDDGNGGTYEKEFTITINDGNDAPTDISLSANSIDENLSVGTVIADLTSTDQDATDSHSYDFATGTGDTDNGSFTISGTQLLSGEVFDVETKSSYSVRLVTDDGNGGTYEEAFTITINDDNDAPTDITLSSSAILEEQSIGTVIGSISSTDQDASDSHSYELVSGDGDTDNSSFTISGSNLESAERFDYEVKSSYTIRLRSTDNTGGNFEKSFSISVTDGFDEPTDIELSSSVINENESAGTNVGSLSTMDQSTDETYTYQLVSGAGDDDNASFTISNDQLQSAASFDFETQNSYAIRVQSDDSNGGSVQVSLSITIVDLNEAPVFAAISDQEFNEETELTFSVSATDEDLPAQTLTYTLDQTSLDAGMTLDGSTGAFSWTPGENQQGTHEVTFTVSDGSLTDESSITLTVLEVNVAPVLDAIGERSIDEKKNLSFTVFSTDHDLPAQTLTFSLDAASISKGMSINSESGVFEWTPTEEQDGIHDVVFTVSDGSLTDQETVVITVNEVNENPNLPPTNIVLSNSSIDAYEAVNTVVGTLTTDDADDQIHTYELVSGVGFGLSNDNLINTQVFTNRVDSTASVTIKTIDPDDASFTKTFEIEIVGFVDTEAPSITSLSDPEVFPSGSSSITLSAMVTDFELNAVAINYRPLTEDDFVQESLSSDNDTYTFSVSKELMGETGLEYYFSASDKSGNSAESVRQQLVLTFNSTQSPDIQSIVRFGGQVTDYQLISIPYKFSGSNNRVDAIFDEYGGDPDQTNWRIIRYDNARNGIVDLTGSYGIKIGEGYFFIAREDKEVSVGEASINDDIAFELELKANWNLIGNPYNVNIDWDKVLERNNVAGVGPLRVLDPTNAAGWPESTLLKKYEGAFVQATEDVTISVRYEDIAASSGRTNYSYELPETDWFSELTLSQGSFSHIGGVGMAASASNEFDSFDALTLPRWIRYLEFNFAHPEHSYGRFSRDVVSRSDKYVWEFTVSSDQSGPATLAWPDVNVANLKLLDLETQEFIDMSSAGSYQFDLKQNKPFKVFFSVDPTDRFLGDRVTIGDAYPNPISERFFVPVSLPENDQAYVLNLEIVDLTGMVLTASDRQLLLPGYHEIQFDAGEGISSGIYLYRLSINDGTTNYQITKRFIVK